MEKGRGQLQEGRGPPPRAKTRDSLEEVPRSRAAAATRARRRPPPGRRPPAAAGRRRRLHTSPLLSLCKEQEKWSNA